MKALVFESFKAPLTIQTVPDPTPSPDGVVIEVKATGLCLSDWHGWMGHDDDVVLPHVPINFPVQNPFIAPLISHFATNHGQTGQQPPGISGKVFPGHPQHLAGISCHRPH